MAAARLDWHRNHGRKPSQERRRGKYVKKMKTNENGFREVPGTVRGSGPSHRGPKRIHQHPVERPPGADFWPNWCIPFSLGKLGYTTWAPSAPRVLYAIFPKENGIHKSGWKSAPGGLSTGVGVFFRGPYSQHKGMNTRPHQGSLFRLMALLN